MWRLDVFVTTMKQLPSVRDDRRTCDMLLHWAPRAAKDLAMQYRNLPGWDGAVEAARRAWHAISDETWTAVGDLEAPPRVKALGTPTHLLSAITRTGNKTVVNRMGIGGFRRTAWEWFFLRR
jgi:hypothetical protein